MALFALVLVKAKAKHVAGAALGSSGASAPARIRGGSGWGIKIVWLAEVLTSASVASRGRVRPRADRPLLSAPGRIWAGTLLAGGTVLISVLGVLFAGQAQADRFDRAVDAPIISWLGGHQHLALWFAAPGTLVPAVVLSAIIVVACVLTGRLNGAVLAATAVPAAAGLNDGLLKDLVHRTYLGALTYPSGHTATIFALAATVGILLLAPGRPGRSGVLRALIPVVACLLGGVVAVGVIGLRWHYFTDTVAGAALGIGTACALALLLDLPVVRRWLIRASRQPDAREPGRSDQVPAGG